MCAVINVDFVARQREPVLVTHPADHEQIKGVGTLVDPSGREVIFDMGALATNGRTRALNVSPELLKTESAETARQKLRAAPIEYDQD